MPARCANVTAQENIRTRTPIRATSHAPGEASFDDENRATLLRRGRLGVALVLAFAPFYAILDWIVAPGHFVAFLLLRVAACALCGVALLHMGRPGAIRHAYVLAAIPAAVVGVSQALMIRLLGGYESPYYVSLALVLFGVGILYPWPPRWSAGVHAGLYASYVVPALLFDRIEHASTFAIHNAFLLGAAGIAISANVHNYRSARDDFERGLQLLRAERLATVGRVAVALKHEINNALAGLIGLVQLLRSTPEMEPGEREEHLTSVEGAGRRISGVIKRLGEIEEVKTIGYVGAADMIDLGRK